MKLFISPPFTHSFPPFPYPFCTDARHECVRRCVPTTPRPLAHHPLPIHYCIYRDGLSKHSAKPCRLCGRSPKRISLRNLSKRMKQKRGPETLNQTSPLLHRTSTQPPHHIPFVTPPSPQPFPMSLAHNPSPCPPTISYPILPPLVEYQHFRSPTDTLSLH